MPRIRRSANPRPQARQRNGRQKDLKAELPAQHVSIPGDRLDRRNKRDRRREEAAWAARSGPVTVTPHRGRPCR